VNEYTYADALGASGFLAFANAIVVGTGVGTAVVVVTVVTGELAVPAEPLDEHAVSMPTTVTTRSNRRSARKMRILTSLVVAAPLAVFGVPLLVARLDLLLPVLGGLA
jgi:hypothetical protein